MTDKANKPQADDEDSEMNDLFDGVSERSTPSAEALARAKAQTTEVWQEVVELELHKQRRQRKRQQRMALVATGLLAIATVLFFRLEANANLEFELAAGQLEQQQQAQATTNEPRKIRLAAGDHSIPGGVQLLALKDARLHLPSGAELRIAQATKVRFVEADRLELLTGQIYIDTHEQADMTIVTSAGEVADIGTQYSVSQNRTGVNIAVRSGSAVLITADRRYQADADQTSAGVIEVSNTGTVQQHQESKSADRWQWIERTAMGYSSHKVSRVLLEIAEDLGVQLRYANVGDQASLATVTYAGNLRNMPPKQALELIALSSDLHWTLDDQILLVSLKQP